MSAHLYAKDMRALRRYGEELIFQCDAYERHTAAGLDDRIRFGILFGTAAKARRVAQRAYRRYHRERGWEWRGTWL